MSSFHGVCKCPDSVIVGSALKTAALHSFITYLVKSADAAYGELEESNWRSMAATTATRAYPTHKQRAAMARIAIIAGNFAGGLLREEILASSKTQPVRRLLMIQRVLLSKHYHTNARLRSPPVQGPTRRRSNFQRAAIRTAVGVASGMQSGAASGGGARQNSSVHVNSSVSRIVV